VTLIFSDADENGSRRGFFDMPLDTPCCSAYGLSRLTQAPFAVAFEVYKWIKSLG
jgi:hypothetical protein